MEDVGAVARRRVLPARERVVGGGERLHRVLRRRVGDRAEHLLGGGVDHVERAAPGRLAPRAAEEQLLRGLLDDGELGFGRGGDHGSEHTRGGARRNVLDEIVAREGAGEISAVDAIVVAFASGRGGGVVLTSDPIDLRTLSAHASTPFAVGAV